MEAETAITATDHGLAIGKLFLDGGLRGRSEAVASVAAPLGRREVHCPLRGRHELVDGLLASVAGLGSGVRVRVLHGLGGCGKTSIALEVAARVSGLPVWWVSGADAASLSAGLAVVARLAGAGEEELRGGDLGDVLWRRLAGLSNGWLLIIDNADDPQVLAGPAGRLADGVGWVRPVPVAGLVLITSRDAAWPGWCQRQRVEVLNVQPAAQVLCDYAGAAAGDEESAKALAAWLGGLPLALRVAGAYLAATTSALLPEPDVPTTFAEYLAAVRSTGRVAFPALKEGSDGDGSQVREMVGRTWELSLDLLASRGLKQARSMLRLLSQFADAPIPYRLLLDPTVLSRSSLLAGEDAAGLSRLLQALTDVALVDLVGDGEPRVPMLRIHPLVREASRGQSNTPDAAAEYLAIAASLLCAAADGVHSDEVPPQDRTPGFHAARAIG